MKYIFILVIILFIICSIIFRRIFINGSCRRTDADQSEDAKTQKARLVAEIETLQEQIKQARADYEQLQAKELEQKKQIDSNQSLLDKSLAQYQLDIETASKSKEEQIQQFQAQITQAKDEYTQISNLLEQTKQQYDLEQKNHENSVAQMNKHITDINALTQTTINEQQTHIQDVLHATYDNELQKYHDGLITAKTQLLTEATNEFNTQIEEYDQEIRRLRAALDDYQAKQNVINEEILRQRAINENQDFYRVSLSQDVIDDMQLLNKIRNKLHSHADLDKVIYDLYISKPVNEMIKRVLKGTNPSGIYKITRLKTGEIYIGRSTEIKTRWQQHAKTAFGVGSIAHSTLHTTMEADGIQNFTFELLEEVSKDRLNEREKYWIDFYQTKQYGLNEKSGG